MAKRNELMKKGIITNVITESIKDKAAFPDKKSRTYYLRLIKAVSDSNPNVKVLGYVILDECAYLLTYTSDQKFLDRFMVQLNESYGSYYNERFGDNGYIFKMPYPKTVINNTDDSVISALSHIHKLPEYNNLTQNYRTYSFSSCRPIFKKSAIVDREFLFKLLDINKLDGVTYTSWHKQGMNKRIDKKRKKKDSYNKAMETCTLRYKGTSLVTDENAIKQIAMDVNERCNTPYRKLEKKLGIKNRRDILIEIIASMVFDRGYTFLEAINQLQAEEYGVFALLIEVIVSLNKRSHYGYDFMINKLEVEDRDYHLLVEIIKSLNRNLGMGFVEIAKRFSLQNNIIELRMRTGI